MTVNQRVVVIGNGMAGFRFVQELLDGAPDRFAVTVIGEEPGGAYNRVLLSAVLAGTVGAGAIELADPAWYAARGVRLLSGVAATGIDRPGRRVLLAGGRHVPYDVLVLATGSTPVLPPVPGLLGDGGLVPGAVAFRTLADCAAIAALAGGSAGGPVGGPVGGSAGSSVVLGGGVLGLEIARGLAGSGLPVTLVQRGPRLMERQLDAGASRVLRRTLGESGVSVRAGASVREVLGGDQVRAVTLDDGSELPSDLLVLCCGTRPRTRLAIAAGLAAGEGVIVDDQLRSVSDPAVFAIGECAQHRGRIHGLVAPCWEQAYVAAQVIRDRGTPARYAGSRDVVRLKAAGIELVSLGDSTVDDAGDPPADLAAGPAADARDTEVITFSDPARGVYQKLVVRDGRLAGAILLGDTRTGGTITQLFDRGTPLPDDRSSLLLAYRGAQAPASDSPLRLPDEATICHCNGVTKSAICAAWRDGAGSVGEVVSRTRATTGCGTCRDAVTGIVEWLAAADPDLVSA